MRWLVGLSLPLFLVACSGGGDDKSDTDTTPGDTDTDTDADTDTDTDADTDADTDTDTDTDTDSATDTGTLITGVQISNLSWELHAEYGSLAVVTWDQSAVEDVHIEYSFDKGIWHSSPTVEGQVGLNEQLIVGIPYDSLADWRVVAETATVDAKLPIETDPVPNGLLANQVLVSDPAAWLPEGNYLLSSVNQNAGGWTGGTYWTFIMDRDGRYVWARKAPMSHWTLYASVAKSGDHILWDEATAWVGFPSDNGAASRVHRTYLDEEIEVIATPGLHHAFIEHDDGTLAWGSLVHNNTETLVEQAPGAKVQTEIWNCGDDWPGVNHCESNCIWYDADRDTYLYSFYTNSSLVELSRSTGESLWWAGDAQGGFAFDPPNKEFEWQHGVTWTDAGTLLISSEAWDNGFTTKVYEYTVDEKAGVLTNIWEYDAGIYAATNGDALRLSNGNTMHAVGAAGQIHEVDANGNQVWVVAFPGNHLVGRAEFIEDLYALVSP